MRQLQTVASVAHDHNIFQNTFDLLQKESGNVDASTRQLIYQLDSRFSSKDMRRFYASRNYVGGVYRLYEDNDLHIEVARNAPEGLCIKELNVIVAPVKRLIHTCSNITGHTNHSIDNVPKNNIDKDALMIIDLNTKHDGRANFQISSNYDQLFKQNDFFEYVHQEDSINNYYMPPNKQIRKEYRSKIEALVNKATLTSFLKEDEGKNFSPEFLRELYKKRWKKPIEGELRVEEQAYNYVRDNYDGQMTLKMVLQQQSKPRYSGFNSAITVIKEMVKYYTEFRNEVPVNYFTCDVSKNWSV